MKKFDQFSCTLCIMQRYAKVCAANLNLIVPSFDIAIIIMRDVTLILLHYDSSNNRRVIQA